MGASNTYICVFDAPIVFGLAVSADHVALS
jgi:hypothetical protein